MFGRINISSAKRAKPRGKRKEAPKSIFDSEFPEPKFLDKGILATDGCTYYKKALIEGQEFNLFDSAQILTSDTTGSKDHLYYALILQMRSDTEGNKQAKVNWYWRKDELPEELKCFVLRRELLLSEAVEYIPLDAIRSKITVYSNVSNIGRKINHLITANTSEFLCNRGFFTCQAEFVAVSTIRRLMNLTLEDIEHVESGSKYDIARARLQLNYVKAVLGRQGEMQSIKAAIERFLMRGGCGGCLYISGVPGTGKTLCVKEVMKQIGNEVISGKIKDFEFYEINCLRFGESNNVFKEIWYQLTGEKLSVKSSIANLNALFTKSPPEKYMILLIDEIDILLTRKQTEIYCLMEWACLPKSHLIVICIANIMDLEQRLAPKVQSRFGKETIRFYPYKSDELKIIVEGRIKDLGIFHPTAIDYLCKNIANVGGDARKALEACRRSLDFVTEENSENSKKKTKSEEQIKLKTMVRAVKDMQEIRGMSILEKITLNEKLILISFLKEMKLKDLTSASMRDVVKRFYTIQKQFPDSPQVNTTMLMVLVGKLIDIKVLKTQDERVPSANSRLLLVCSEGDLLISLNKDKALKALVEPLMP
ncbi:hypothetical protein TVAG_376490 [Trichomonas vaginalis G3]|uniref:Origin recognition complex subunit 1 n=1 Tax=Trichomonas vaginalis (strain ATCC PRA-98 / G3) TaxID=412133 RepID=A2FU77_TRIV3|nr:DNA replication [Trichomonas vaginalis G3]EAX91538.1 hypothetical protein TVAG_376490 [Trichomonas vaginalis G3]KAI5509563.1 DNA replication [Trichomonas vaginalis G3]|eukprot:XP_001304468.1 hypothetical protein [Trichomonas vaginalis G3]